MILFKTNYNLLLILPEKVGSTVNYITLFRVKQSKYSKIIIKPSITCTKIWRSIYSLISLPYKIRIIPFTTYDPKTEEPREY